MINEEQLPAQIIRASLVLLCSTSLISFFLISTPVALGVFSGGSLAILNFLWQRRTLSRILGQQGGATPGSAVFRFLLRLSLSGFVLYLILISGKVSVFGLLAGLSIIVAVIVLFALYAAFQKDKGD